MAKESNQVNVIYRARIGHNESDCHVESTCANTVFLVKILKRKQLMQTLLAVRMQVFLSMC